MEQLIPFEKIGSAGASGMILLFVLLAVFIWFLQRGAGWLVEGAAQLAYRLGMPKIVIGATIVSLGTTSPEAAVSVFSAFRGDAGLALGNALGSVICDTGLVFGLGCLIATLPLDRFILNRHGWLQFGAAVLLVVLIAFSTLLYPSPRIARWMGVGLLGLLAAYLAISVHWARSHPDMIETVPQADKSVLVCLALLVGGLVIVVISSKLLIADVETICHLLRIPPSFVSATLVAFGTSLPELVTALTSIRRGHPELLVGNVLGADILNILFVIGASATASPLDVPPEVIWFHIPAMLVILGLFRAFSCAKRRTYRRSWGIPLLFVYAVFVVLALVFGLRAG